MMKCWGAFFLSQPMDIPENRLFEVTDRSNLAQNVFSLTLVPADNRSMFSFKAGQWIMLHLINSDGTTWRKAAFSIASAPVESSSSIELGIKIHGELTTRASKLNRGDKVKVQGPYGFFLLRQAPEQLVLLAGGIGITPLRTMIRECCLQKSDREIFLFYCERTREEMAYEQELRDLAARHPNFKPTFILTRVAPQNWDGELTRISVETLQGRGIDLATADFMACGSSSFVQNIKEMLELGGVNLKNKFKQESF